MRRRLSRRAQARRVGMVRRVEVMRVLWVGEVEERNSWKSGQTRSLRVSLQVHQRSTAMSMSVPTTKPRQASKSSPKNPIPSPATHLPTKDPSLHCFVQPTGPRLPNPNWTSVKAIVVDPKKARIKQTKNKISKTNATCEPKTIKPAARRRSRTRRKVRDKNDCAQATDQPRIRQPSPVHPSQILVKEPSKAAKTEERRRARRAHRSTPGPTLMSSEPLLSSVLPPLTPPEAPLKQEAFVGNLDFIRLESSDEDKKEGSKDDVPGASTPSKRKQEKARGTKRKRGNGPGMEDGQPCDIRKKKGAVITPWLDGLKWKGRSVQQMLTAEIASFVSYIRPTREEDQLRCMLIEMIRKTVRTRWPDARVEPFGSFGTKLYLPGGDIDLVILSQKMMSEPKTKILYKLAPIIRESNIGQDVVVISKAKVPIIKFKTIFGNFNVDISLNQSNGLVAMEHVNQLLDDIKHLSLKLQSPSEQRKTSGSVRSREKNDCRHRRRETEDPTIKVVEELGAAKCLILVIKSVLKQRGMNEVYTGGLGSYSVICLVISFLQLHPKIQRGDIDPNKNLGVLLLEFFELYGKYYNFDHTGISVRKGGYYFSKSQRGWYRERQPFLLSIEDPADEGNDISGGSHNILGVKCVFSGAFDLLSATLYHRHSLQLSRADASESSLSHPLLSVPVPALYDGDNQTEQDPMAQSLLGEIMGVTKDLVDHRKKNLKLYYSGTLQRVLNWPPPQPRDPPTNDIKGDDRNRQSGDIPCKQSEKDHLQASSASAKRGGDKGRSSHCQQERSMGDGPEPPRQEHMEHLHKTKDSVKASELQPWALWVEDVEPQPVSCLPLAAQPKGSSATVNRERLVSQSPSLEPVAPTDASEEEPYRACSSSSASVTNKQSTSESDSKCSMFAAGQNSTRQQASLEPKYRYQ